MADGRNRRKVEETAEKTGEAVEKGLKKGWRVIKAAGKGAKDEIEKEVVSQGLGPLRENRFSRWAIYPLVMRHSRVRDTVRSAAAVLLFLTVISFQQGVSAWGEWWLLR